ncbi:MAG: hypothetical protein OXH06_06365 [Gemmatimonadetes bacterium]|nr:hypothetical protein [Gemmatimonadota bacterium]MDE3257583.1 hypothetical protein [Gemmatimonadota bacterium]
MSRELVTKVAIVFVLVALAAVTLSFIFGDPFLPGYRTKFVTLALGLALGILFVGASIAAVVYTFGYVFIRLKRYNRGNTGEFETKEPEAFKARLNEMDHRLTDVQDILITVDEKLSRLQENKGTA